MQTPPPAFILANLRPISSPQQLTLNLPQHIVLRPYDRSIFTLKKEQNSCTLYFIFYVFSSKVEDKRLWKEIYQVSHEFNLLLIFHQIYITYIINVFKVLKLRY